MAIKVAGVRPKKKISEAHKAKLLKGSSDLQEFGLWAHSRRGFYVLETHGTPQIHNTPTQCLNIP